MKTQELVTRMLYVITPIALFGFIVSLEYETSTWSTNISASFQIKRIVSNPKKTRTSCKARWTRYNVDSGVNEPTIKLNQDSFLLPVLVNGPNNQLLGFRKSIYVAILLNRTVVLPRFFKHMSKQ